MKKKLQSFILILVMLLELMPPVSLVSAAEQPSSWNLDSESYVISTVADLDAFRSAIAGGYDFGGKTITLANDINVGNAILSPIKTDTNKPEFNGVLDGQGHKIIGFNDASGGLVYTIGNWNGKNGIKNLELNVSISDNVIAADQDYYAVAKNVGAVIENCKVSGSIIRSDAAAGTVTSGFTRYLNTSSCSISNCISAIDINAGNGTACGVATDTDSGSFANCLSRGNLTGATVVPITGSSNTTDSFYNMEGIAGTLSDNNKGTGKTDSELKQGTTFTNWDGNYIWKLVEGSYPELKVFSAVTQADIELFNQTIATGEIEVAKTTYYTPASITAIQTALSAAKAVKTETASMTDLQSAGKNLQTAITNAIVIADKSGLQAIIDQAGTYINNVTNYTAYSIDDLNFYVNDAKTTALDNPETDKDTVDYYIETIQDKIDALVSIDELNKALTQSDGFTAKKSEYTSDSIGILETAVTTAEEILTKAADVNTEVTKDQVAVVVKGINNAITGLVKISQTEPTNTWEPSKGIYVISTVADLDAFRKAIAEGEKFGGKTITLANDIAIENIALTPIKTATNKPEFEGVLDGQGHKINGFNDISGGLVYTISNWDNKNGIKNLELNVSIPDHVIAPDQDYYAVGQNLGAVIENCKVSGSITRTDAAVGTTTSGFINYMSMSSCSISNCISAIDINAGNGTACGIASDSGNGNFTNCLSQGILTGATVLPISGAGNVTDSFYNTSGIAGTLSDNSKGTGKTDSELKQIATFTNWDGNYTWKLVEGSYPELKVFSAVTQADIDLFNQTVATGETEAAKTTYYTPASIAAMQTALTAAKAVNPAEASMITLQNAGKNLQTAIKNAIVIPDKNGLQAMIDKAGIYNSSNYTAYSFKYLTSAINSANSLMINAEASQTSVDASAARIQEKIDALVSVVDLNTALTNSDAYQAVDYTTDSFATLTAAVTAAETVSTQALDKYNKTVTSDVINAAVKGINDAIAELVKVNQGVDKSALQKVVTDADAAGYLEANYSSEAWKIYSDCLSTAKAVLAKTDATQTEVDTAKTNLASAITTTLANGALTADKTALKAQLDRAGTLIESNYTPESYAVMTTARADAQTCYDNSKLTKQDQTTVDAKTADLKSAIDALVKVNVNTPPTLNKNEAGQYVVSTVADLNALRSDLQNGYTYTGETVIMTGDIDATGLKAYQTPLTQYYIFDGTFDGRGHMLSNYSDDQSGLFSIIGSNGIVGNFIVQVNLTYDGATGIDYKAFNSSNRTNGTGIVADYNGGKVTRCGITGTIAFTGADSAGSLVGEQNTSLTKTVGDMISLKGTIKNCYSRAAVTSSSTEAINYYGFCENGTVQDSYYAGIWSGALSGGSQPIGSGTITNCFYDSNILGISLNDAKGTANVTRMMKKETTYTTAGWDFTQSWSVDSIANDGYPKLDFSKKNTLNKRQVISLKFVLEPRTFNNTADFENCRMTKLKEVQIVNDIGTNPYHLKVDYSIKDDPFYVGTMGDDARGYVTFNSLKLTYDANNEVDYELDPEVLTSGQRNIARGQFLENSAVDPTADQQKQIIANSKAACNLIIKKWLGENPEPTKNYDSWIIISAARNNYPVPDGFYDEYFKTICKKYTDLKTAGVEGKTFDACDTAKDALLIESIGYDPRSVGGYDLIDILSRKDTATNGKYFASQYENFAITAQDFTIASDSEHNDVNAYIHDLAQIKTTDVQGNAIQNDTASDMAVMGIQPIMAYYNPNAQPGDEWYDVKVAVEYYLKMFENAQSYKGTFWGGFGGSEYTGSKDFDLANYWTNAQVNLSLGMAGISPFDPRFVKNGKSPLDGILTAFDLEKGTYDSYIDSYDPTQITRGINALIRAAEGKNQFFNMRDVTNSTVVVNNAIAALPETITADNKAIVESAADLYDALNDSKKATINTANTAKLTAAKTAVGISQPGEAAKVVIAQITALPETTAITLDNQKAVVDARSAYNALSKDDQKAVTNYKKLTDCEAKIVDLQKSEGIDRVAAQGVTNQINALGTITSFDQKAAVEAARSAYNSLTKSQKFMVTVDTLDILTKAEAAIEKLKPTTGSITIDVERFTIGQGFYVEPVTLAIKEGETARQAIEELLGAENLIGEVGYLRAVKGADTGKATIPDYIVSKIGGANSAVANAYSSRYGGDILGEFDYSKYSGWYYLVNNKAPNVGMNAYTLKDGEVMRLAFTYWGTGSDITGIEFGSNKTLVNIANKDSLLKAIAAVNANKSTYLSDAGIKTAYDTAMTVAQDMTATLKATNDAATALNKAVTDSSGTDKTAAKTVTDKIAALPAVSKLALTDKAVVTAARTAYDGLTAIQKTLVTNLSTLTAAEAKIAELEKEATEAANKAAAKAVTDKIAALPSGTALLLGEKADVTAARIAYNALTETQKALVTNLNTLILAEARIAELEAETPIVKDEKTGIEAIGLPKGTTLKVGNESADADKTGEALKLAKKEGIKDAKIIALYTIKPDMSDDDLAKFNNDPDSFVTLTLPLGGSQQGYNSYKIYHKKTDGTVEWITPTLSEDGKSLSFKVNAFSDFGVVGTKTSADTEIPVVDVSYCTHVQNVGWQDWRNNGDMSGTEGKSLRLEGIQIKRTDKADVDLGIRYETHIENIGWEDDWKTDGDTSGTEGRSLRLEAIRIELTGADAKNYDVYYQVHAQNIGWMGFAQNGKEAGTAGFGYRLEGIRVVVVPKGQAAPTPEDGSIETAFLIRR
ncbi:DUF4430 domain-containing protein [Acetobacterium woodii]|uniref:Uncharacterized protein n=1 Tax=Acetobacterium woodii (strain ATCC 29683 / DSM 1030 / JCM 2381 / KCTC 1655 / WB1) TaxID=931626 RepID=H6LIQ6_ACEWD|nr:DUF4430 domain-containing protein [Acetobacterium woodii]AFA49795.1 hypothetical protein Awo_c30670 [Acetobacterium woodii DSM 1030]